MSRALRHRYGYARGHAPRFTWTCVNPKCHDYQRPLISEAGGGGKLVCDRCGVLMKKHAPVGHARANVMTMRAYDPQAHRKTREGTSVTRHATVPGTYPGLADEMRTREFEAPPTERFDARRTIGHAHAHYRDRWVAEMAEALQRGGFADPEANAGRLFDQGYGPEEIEYRVRTHQIESQLGIPRARSAR